jgi:hypothetical protein
MTVITDQISRITLWSPQSSDIKGPLEDAIVQCLAAAFGSGVWARTPMPTGDSADPHSARGIVAQLRSRARVLLAYADRPIGAVGQNSIIGCVLGCVLDEALIDMYRIDDYDAKPGDALLAYIGVEPASQGYRAFHLSGNQFALRSRHCNRAKRYRSESLAGVLFARWLALRNVAACPHVFVRTRSVLGPVLHMIEKNGFEYRGQFDLDFHGERQDRMVFARSNLQKPLQNFSSCTSALAQPMMV